MPKIHCAHKCQRNRNNDDHCELPDSARVYQDGCYCSGYKGKQGPWTDIYACAATLYFMVTGIVPPDGTERLVEDDWVAIGDLVPEADGKPKLPEPPMACSECGASITARVNKVSTMRYKRPLCMGCQDKISRKTA